MVKKEKHLSTECELVSEIINIMIEKELQTLVEWVIFCFHICVPVTSKTLLCEKCQMNC